MPRFRLVHVDLDGTLVDSRDDIVASTNALRTSFGLEPLTAEAVLALVGRGARVLVEGALGLDRHDLHDEGLRRFLEHYAEHCLDRTRPYPGIPEAIERLGADGVRFSIVTNKEEALTRRMLERLGLDGRFVAIVGGDTFPARKPDPSGIESIRAREGVDRAATLMVGDSPIDVETARAGGIACCGVLWGLDPEGLRRACPDLLVRDGNELEAAIRG